MNQNDCITKKDTYYLEGLSSGEQITVRELQLELLPIMDEIHRVCQQNNIPYALMAGSALGICNYKGFIPWDDDMDVLVPRSHWNAFIEAMKQDLDTSKFYFQCYETDPDYNVIMGPTMKVRKRGTYIEEVNYLLRNKCKSGDGIFIDVIIYDNVAESKWTDEWNRSVIKLVMPFYVLFDNLGFRQKTLKRFIRWYSNRYSRKHEESKLVSQPISVPWEKFLKEPVFLKEDVFPVELYEFEGRQYYSYHNIEAVMKQWYGPNCLKKWNGTEFEETLSVEKRKPKHVKDLNLNGEKPIRK